MLQYFKIRFMKIESYILVLLMFVVDAFDRIRFKYISPLNVPTLVRLLYA